MQDIELQTSYQDYFQFSIFQEIFRNISYQIQKLAKLIICRFRMLLRPFSVFNLFRYRRNSKKIHRFASFNTLYKN